MLRVYITNNTIIFTNNSSNKNKYSSSSITLKVIRILMEI